MTPANDNRPADFDARLLGYMPHLKRLASRLCNNADEREELVQESLAYILSHWTSFRPDGGFYNWITLCMRHKAQDKRRREAKRKTRITFVDDEESMVAASYLPNQLDRLELLQTLEQLDSNRHGEVVLRRAMGEGLREIADEYGVSKERIRQREELGRRSLQEAA